MEKYFIITIDTEGDNIWSRTEDVTVENAKYLPRFQSLCEKYGFKPTYLTNYEMAQSNEFRDFGKSIILNKSGEIGMHLHAWHSPPKFILTDKDWKYHPYLIEYPVDIIFKKVKFMTDYIEDIFGIKVVSHRAGRWSFNEEYANILVEHGYQIDCSVTPGVSWKNNIGDPTRNGGTNYQNFPRNAYFLDLENINQKGNSSLLEVPMTILSQNHFHPMIATINTYVKNVFNNSNYISKILKRGITGALNRIYPKNYWLRPDINNLNQMKNIVNESNKMSNNYIEFMLHSSELMPGGSNRFKSEESIEKLYKDLEILFEIISKSFQGITLKGYYKTKQKDIHKA